jgi:hypothetical protein
VWVDRRAVMPAPPPPTSAARRPPSVPGPPAVTGRRRTAPRRAYRHSSRSDTGRAPTLSESRGRFPVPERRWPRSST